MKSASLFLPITTSNLLGYHQSSESKNAICDPTDELIPTFLDFAIMPLLSIFIILILSSSKSLIISIVLSEELLFTIIASQFLYV